MKGRAYGIPRGSSRPRSPFVGEGLSDGESFFWCREWEGQGYYPTIGLHTAINAWFVKPTATEYAIRMEAARPLNLTHGNLQLDQFWVLGEPNNLGNVHIEYSYDGVNFSRLPVKGQLYANHYCLSRPCATLLYAYLYVPPTPIRAKYWGIVADSTDGWSSDYGDDEWHFGNLKLGSLDGFEEDIVVDLTKAERGAYVLNTDNTKPWVNVIRHIDIPHQLGVMQIRGWFSSIDYVGERFALDWPTIKANIPRSIGSSTLKRWFPLWTKTGPITGMYVNDGYESAEMDYANTTGNSWYDYRAFGFVNAPNRGCEVVPLRGEAMIDGDPRKVRHRLGAIPDCVWAAGSGTATISHPDVDDVTFTYASSTEPTLVKLIDRVYLPYLLAVVDHDPATVVLLRKTDGFFDAGSYIGTGVSGLVVSTGTVKAPKLVLIKKRGTTTGMQALLTGTYYNFSTLGNTTNYMSVIYDGFRISTTSADVNQSGQTYLWWAFG